LNPGKSALRKEMRQRRRALTPQQQARAERVLAKHLFADMRNRKCRRIAAYLANDGEVSTQAVIQDCWHRGVEVYLPVLNPLKKGHLLFVRYEPGSPMRDNRFGIAEPDPTRNKALPSRHLDLVLMPLVAFDDQGNRLGMGGGFYDRSFEFRRPDKQASPHKPRLIGLAHHCQRSVQLPIEPWDIPLSEIIAV